MNLWLELTLVIGGFFTLFGVLPALVRRWMNADRQKISSDDHVNEFHKKGNWAIRIVMLVSILANFTFFQNTPFFPLVVLAGCIMLSYVFQAYIEWKHTDNPANYKASLMQLTLIGAAFFYAFYWIEISPIIG
ncbi:DUF4181 domain-containing protein [Salibacterium qingdaonense]|uniref:DUF4181 domain-containing protein n=1 Tax=Salibacterium qingdaonense TaxID=266892 RepID=A0A1I4LMZ7_9BACI|nr:DUF4181 domain-containing protein [Salibacterium qingdaonense]SFL92345.1 protein of unknown function [Salibacterium qingdaonense]